MKIIGTVRGEKNKNADGLERLYIEIKKDDAKDLNYQEGGTVEINLIVDSNRYKSFLMTTKTYVYIASRLLDSQNNKTHLGNVFKEKGIGKNQKVELEIEGENVCLIPMESSHLTSGHSKLSVVEIPKLIKQNCVSHYQQNKKSNAINCSIGKSTHNATLSSQQFFNGIKQSLENKGIDYENIIRDFGQVTASEKRDRGEPFGFNDHIKGLILALLSNQRSWGPIAANLENISEIFFNYDYEKIKNINYTYFVSRITQIKCGNRSINDQMKYLYENLNTMVKIQLKYGSLDNFLISDSVDTIAKKLGDGEYKLRQVGYTLALEYLRNMGIKAPKPDLHIKRLLSNERLGYFYGIPSEEEAVKLLGKMADEIGCNRTYLDNLTWIFCAQDYGNICGAEPKCHQCKLSSHCNYPRNN